MRRTIKIILCALLLGVLVFAVYETQALSRNKCEQVLDLPLRTAPFPSLNDDTIRL